MHEKSIKVVFFDVDGLLIVGRQFNFARRLSEEHGVPLESIQDFFLHDFKPCPLGRADLKEVLSPLLVRWGWKGGVDGLLSFWFESENTVDGAVLDVVRTLRRTGTSCYLATRQEKYRFHYISRQWDLRESSMRHFLPVT